MPQPFLIEVPIPVRTYDIDFAGIVSNIVYIRWLEDLRLEMLTRYLPLDEQAKIGNFPVLVSTNIEYKRPIRLFDAVIGKMWIKELGNARIVIGAEFLSNAEISTAATQVTVFVSAATMRPLPIPQHLRDKFEEMNARE